MDGGKAGAGAATMAPIATGHGLAFRRRAPCDAVAWACRADPLHSIVFLGTVAALFCFFFRRRKPPAAPSAAELPLAAAGKLSEGPAAAPAAAPAPGDPHTPQEGAPRPPGAAQKTSPAKMPPLNMEVIKIDKSQPLQSQVAVVSVTLAEDYDRTCVDDKQRRAYCVALLRPLASNLGVPRACVGVGAMQRGSIVADLVLVQRPSYAPGGKGQASREHGNFDAHSLAQELVRALKDSASPLRANTLYAKVADVQYVPTGDLRSLHSDTVIALRNMMEPSNWPNASTSANSNRADAPALKPPAGAPNGSKSTAVAGGGAGVGGEGGTAEADFAVLGDASRLASGSDVDGYITTETSPRNPPRSLGLGPLQYSGSDDGSLAKERARPLNPLQHYSHVNGWNGDAAPNSEARPPLAPPIKEGIKEGGASPQAEAASRAAASRRSPATLGAGQFTGPAAPVASPKTPPSNNTPLTPPPKLALGALGGGSGGMYFSGRTVARADGGGDAGGGGVLGEMLAGYSGTGRKSPSAHAQVCL